MSNMTSTTIAATHLVLVRHGQSLSNRDGEQAGSDSGLTEFGWRQAQAVADWLAETYCVQAVLASKLVRARQTAEIIALRLGLPLTIHEGVEEAEASYWEELPQGAGDPLDLWCNDWQPNDQTAPIYTRFRAQLRASLEQLLRQYNGQTIILVTHGGTIGTIVRSLFGGHQVLVFTENTGITQLTWERNQWRLICHNSIQHLASIMPPARPEEPPPPATVSRWGDERQFSAITAQFRRIMSAATAPPDRLDQQQLGRLVQLTQPRASDRMLDAATGTGAVALAFAPHVRSVLGVDLSPSMLERAETARSQQRATNVHFRLGEIGALPLAQQSFELIVCHDLLHYVSDVSALFKYLRSLLVPGGKLVLDELIGSDDPVKRATQNAIELRRNPVITELLSASDIERKLAAAGFAIRGSERYGVHRELNAWLAQVAADETTNVAVRAMLEAGLDADSAGMTAHRNRDNQIVFSQTRLRLLAVSNAAAEE